MTEVFAQFIVDQIKERGASAAVWLTLIICVLGAIPGYIAGWLVSKRIAWNEYRKGVVDLNTAIYGQLKTINETRDLLNKQSELVSLGLRDLYIALQNADMGQVSKAREELCRVYSSEFLPVFQRYVEEVPALITEQKEISYRLKADLVPDLQLMARFVDTVNLELLLVKIGNPAPYRLDKASFEALTQRIKDMCRTPEDDSLSWEIQKVEHAMSKFFR